MRKLIYGLTYLNDFGKVELVEMWLQLVQHFNPDCDIVVIDTPANPSFAELVPSLQRVKCVSVAEGGPLPKLKPGLNWISFTDNIGHLSLTGQDGWSRAFCRGIQIGLEQHYDYVAHIEGDLLCSLRFNDVIADMKRHHAGAMSTIATKWNFMETGIIFMDCNYLRQIEFLKHYDWRTICKDHVPYLPEFMVHQMMGEGLLYRLWSGGRDEDNFSEGYFKDEDISRISILTHAKDRHLYHHFMNVHAPSLNWHPLFPELPDDERSHFRKPTDPVY